MALRTYEIVWADNVTKQWARTAIIQALTNYYHEHYRKQGPYKGFYQFPNLREMNNKLILRVDEKDLEKAINSSKLSPLVGKILTISPLEEKI